MKRSLLLSLVLFPVVAGLFFGGAFWARRSTSPAPEKTVPVAVPEATPPAGEIRARLAREWREALTKRDPVERAEAMLSSLASADSTSLAALAARHLDDPDTLETILHRWAEVDPRAAADWIREPIRKDNGFPVPLLDLVAEVWAAHDSAGLTAWLKEPVNRSMQYRLVPLLAGSLLARSPEAAFALAKEFPDQWSLPDTTLPWVKADPARAAQILGELPMNLSFFNLIGIAGAAWAEKDGPGAAAWARRLMTERGPKTSGLMSDILRTWAIHDPAAATEFSGTLPPGQRYSYWGLQQWAKKDAPAALAWIEANAATSERQSLTHGTILSAGKKDATATATLVEQMPEGGLRDKATQALAEVWIPQNPTVAAAWAAAQPNGPGRDEALVKAARVWGTKDALAAAEWAKSAPEGTLPGSAYAAIMDSLRKSRADAWAWLNELPPAAAQQAASRFLGSSADDFQKALTLQDGPYRSLVVDRVANGFIRHSAPEAIALAPSLPPDQRAFLRGFVESAEPAEKAGETPGALTAEKKAELLRALQ